MLKFDYVIRYLSDERDRLWKEIEYAKSLRRKRCLITRVDSMKHASCERRYEEICSAVRALHLVEEFDPDYKKRNRWLK